jgi:hypothetical protein
VHRFGRSLIVLAMAMAGAVVYACSENPAGPKGALTVPKPMLTVLPPTSGILPIPDSTTPAFTVTLPSYPDPLIAEFTVDGYVGVAYTRFSGPPKFAGVVDAQGYTRNDVCRMQVKFTYFYNGIVTGWGPGACSGVGSAFKSHWVDTATIQGNGSVSRGGPIYQEEYECPTNTVPSHGTACWSYDTASGHTFTLRPLSASINLTTPGTAETAPGYIDRPPAGTWTVFRVSATPSQIKNINVPIRVISWQWTAATGGSGGTVLTGGATAIQRSAYITENGSMVVSAVVNGLQQVDTVTVGPPDSGVVTIVPDSARMRPTIVLDPPYIPRHDTSTQVLTVSVRRPNGSAIPNRTVTLTLAATEGSAGHLHMGSPPKPAGSLNGQPSATINTGPTGILHSVVFTAPAPAGPVVIRGVSTGSAPGLANIDVRTFPDVIRYEAGVGYLLIGGDTHSGKHPDNHYALQEHIAKLQQLASRFSQIYGHNLEYNDSSLEWGGLFDFDWEAHPWQTPHGGHREGKHTDLRQIADPQNNIPALSERKLNKIRRIWEHDLGGEVHVEGDHRHLVYPIEH